MAKLTHDKLLDWLSYDPVTGLFTYIGKPRPGVRLGSIAGNIHPVYGYIIVCVLGKQYRANRLAWFYMTGEWPEFEVDHKDGNKQNNSFCNLRLATRSQNMANVSTNSKNKSGYKGVCWHKRHNSWASMIRFEGKRIWLGNFDNKEDAALAYNFAALLYFGEYARLNVYEN